MASGSWALAEELFARADAAFVSELRAFTTPIAWAISPRVGWPIHDPRPGDCSRTTSRCLSTPTGTRLWSGLFKAAEKAGDDDLMGLFLVAFDRCVRRNRKTITRQKWESVSNREAAEALVREWERDGYSQGTVHGSGGRFYAYAQKREDVIVAQRRHAAARREASQEESADGGSPLEGHSARHGQISSMAREALRSFQPSDAAIFTASAWRYFRKLGKTNVERYRAGAVVYLMRYTDADVDSDVHLLDNWGLVHTLFFASTAGATRERLGFRGGKDARRSGPAPRFASAWISAPEALLELLTQALCRTVRQWLRQMLLAYQADWLCQRPVATLLALTDHADPDFAGARLRYA